MILLCSKVISELLLFVNEVLNMEIKDNILKAEREAPKAFTSYIEKDYGIILKLIKIWQSNDYWNGMTGFRVIFEVEAAAAIDCL